MGDSRHDQQPRRGRATDSSRLGIRGAAAGEIVQVQGGHIVRSIGRKDRHSKVCTAKGPRDRRVRLSAHTAIQFYDVQDRLGYDRPSKAVDWLIKKARAAINELDELPPWKPTAGPIVDDSKKSREEEDDDALRRQQQVADAVVGAPSEVPASILGIEGEAQLQKLQKNGVSNASGSRQSFLPPQLDSDAIADTIKTFFPTESAVESGSSSAMQFTSFSMPELLSRTARHSQDLRLSLQSFQDPIFLNHGNPQARHHQNITVHNEQLQPQGQPIFSGADQLGFDLTGWSENQAVDIGRFQRTDAWYGSGDGGGGGAFMFNSPSAPPLFGQTHSFSQRGSLQSSNTPSFRAWMDPSVAAAAVTVAAAAADPHQIQHHHQPIPTHSSFAGIGVASGFSGFRILTRIHGEQEEHDGHSDKPSSASSDSRH